MLPVANLACKLFDCLTCGASCSIGFDLFFNAFLFSQQNRRSGLWIQNPSVLTGALTEPPMDLYESNDSHSLKGHTNVYGLEIDCKE